MRGERVRAVVLGGDRLLVVRVAPDRRRIGDLDAPAERVVAERARRAVGIGDPHEPVFGRPRVGGLRAGRLVGAGPQVVLLVVRVRRGGVAEQPVATVVAEGTERRGGARDPVADRVVGVLLVGESAAARRRRRSELRRAVVGVGRDCPADW